MKESTETYAQYCGLTCWGGSEKKQCECRGPADCEMKNKPGFEAARKEAKNRLLRVSGVAEALGLMFDREGNFLPSQGDKDKEDDET